MTATPPDFTRYDNALLDYATGTLAAGPAFVVSAHLLLKPEAAALAHCLDAAGGALLDWVDPVPMQEPEWMVRGDAAPPAVRRQPMVAGVLNALDAGVWRRGLSGLLTKPVASTPGVRLMKLEAGRTAPRHGHRGLELTLVLAGEFEDDGVIHTRGDLVVHDEDTEHAPGAPARGDCICLVAEPGPVRLKGPVGWVLDRMAG